MSAQIKEAWCNAISLAVANNSAEPLEVEFVLLHHLQRPLKLPFRLQFLFACIRRSLNLVLLQQLKKKIVSGMQEALSY
jgi:hypothetical protein